MTVKELIEQLKKLDPEATVVVSVNEIPDGCEPQVWVDPISAKVYL